MSPPYEGAVPPLGRRSISPDAIAPDGSEIRLLVTTVNGATKSSLVEVVLNSGQVTRPVRHRTVEEVWYVLDGVGEVWRCPPDGRQAAVPAADLRPGDSLVIPTGWTFQFRAGSDGLLRFLCHTTPPWPGEHEAVPVEHGGLGDATV
jgi:mannose-6-phosphate isomerase-like protein (cupin superfamily)